MHERYSLKTVRVARKPKNFNMKYLFVLLLAIVLISFVACNENSLLGDEPIPAFQQFQIENSQTNNVEFEPMIDSEGIELPNCLEETVIDSFIFYFNEFNNYLLQEDNITYLCNLDSIEILNLVVNASIEDLEDFYLFYSNTFDIPFKIVENAFIYSAKIQKELEKETELHHPIADRWHLLIKNGCLNSVYPPDIFDADQLSVILRHKCSFWGLFTSCAGLALWCASVVVTGPTVIGVAGSVVSAVSYGMAIADCL